MKVNVFISKEIAIRGIFILEIDIENQFCVAVVGAFKIVD